MLRRFADHRLRAELDKTRDSREKYRTLAELLAARLRESRRTLRAARHALETQAQLTERWRLIAQGAQNELEALRAEHRQETTP